MTGLHWSACALKDAPLRLLLASDRRAAEARDEPRRAEFLARRAALRGLLAALCPEDAALPVEADLYGAPTLRGSALRVSVSSASGWALVGASSARVGVDAEHFRAAAPGGALRWTVTEAALKALGTGLAVPPEALSGLPDGATAPAAGVVRFQSLEISWQALREGNLTFAFALCGARAFTALFTPLPGVPRP